MVAAQHAAKSSHFCPVQDQPFSHHGLKNGISVRTRTGVNPPFVSHFSVPLFPAIAKTETTLVG